MMSVVEPMNMSILKTFRNVQSDTEKAMMTMASKSVLKPNSIWLELQ